MTVEEFEKLIKKAVRYDSDLPINFLVRNVETGQIHAVTPTGVSRSYGLLEEDEEGGEIMVTLSHIPPIPPDKRPQEENPKMKAFCIEPGDPNQGGMRLG